MPKTSRRFTIAIYQRSAPTPVSEHGADVQRRAIEQWLARHGAELIALAPCWDQPGPGFSGDGSC